MSTLNLTPTMASAPRAAVACTHCGLPVARGLVEEGSAEQFCCHGCRTAFAVISGCGLERYYKVRDAVGAESAAVRTTGKRYAEFDDPVFSSLYVKMDGAGLAHVELYLESVHCAACVWLVERLPALVPGTVEARLEPRRALVRIAWDPGQVRLSAIARTLDSLGYAPHPAREAGMRSLRQIDDRRALIRLGVAGACAGNVMLLGLALYAGAFDSMEAEYQQLFRWASMLISLVSVVWPGSVFFRGAWASIRTRTAHLDLPISIGLGAGAIWGVVNTVRGTGEVYFDSLSVLVFALLVGRAIQHRQQRWSADAVELLFSLTPSSARRIDGGGVVDVPIEAVVRGDVLEVRAGDSIPADGVVESGESSVDQSLLTGESVPVVVGPGDGVAAGAVNVSGVIRVRVTATGEATRVGRLMKVVEEGTRRRAPIVRLADRFAAWFVGGMLGLSAITAVVWALIDPSRAVDNAASLLIVTCPCALGLATPLAITVAIGRAARRGILIKGGDAVQVLSGRGVMFLDKTGTLTQGRMSLVRWFGREGCKGLVAAVEAGSAHPIAVALVRDLGAGVGRAVDVVSVTGGGVGGVVGGRSVLVGSVAFVRSRVLDEDAGVAGAEAECVADGLTPVLVAVDDQIVAVAGVGDPLREDAVTSIRAIERAGWEVRVLSGDHPAVVASAARELGIAPERAEGGVMPEAKLQRVTEAARNGPVAMVGDGVNDAAALAAATVGIAVRGGAEASLAAADVYLSRAGLTPIAELLGASRRTLGVIRISLGASLFYNVVAASLAMTGLLNPLIAAILMPVSSLTVLTLAFKARTFGPTNLGDQACR
ncbi:heavy metal translocating P-type ATPase [Synechococcus sp. Cruz CV-v-12]|uniref:heavy metal translocating P-type ATPase n=1 Tax=Synechococcus sp. Cruz CV-v-12 TaxID=2823728 RepID=UPI0020CE4B3E|nr:heavy metal translocating P-type ATPase [Synechococcus sp. Cruz CV-v-12]MCP9874712.1 heavy metal translocating P-type ATPase [Synechococcus sp. Cruz CV-v-12]